MPTRIMPVLALLAAATIAGCSSAAKPPPTFTAHAGFDGTYRGKAEVTEDNIGSCPKTIDIAVTVEDGAGTGSASTVDSDYDVNVWLSPKGEIMKGSISSLGVTGVTMSGTVTGNEASGRWRDTQGRCSGTFRLSRV